MVRDLSKQEKLNFNTVSIILTCQFPGDDESVMYKCNMLSKKWKPWYSHLDLHQQTEILSKRGVHKYRKGRSNRHGYSNDRPSWWALGFENKQEWLDAAYC